MTILIGCSGWSYDDWVGRFYPIDLAKHKEEWLRYYASYFGTVEINSTFYRPPTEFIVSSWIKKGLALKNFEYSVKMPQLVTHDSLVNAKPEAAAGRATSFENVCVKPLAAEKLLGSVLIQMSPYFKNEGNALDDLTVLFGAISCLKYRYAVEFRHRSWLNPSGDELDPKVLALLQDNNVAHVITDGPGFPTTKALTADHAYVRFHGRNYDIWFAEEKEDDYRINKYDYLYSEEQLAPWSSRLRNIDNEVKSMRVYFNNHGRAKAVKNAFQMMDLLSIPHREKEIQVQDQMTLGNYQATKT